MSWQVAGSKQLELADRDREWDADAATKRVYDWAGGDDFDVRKVKRAYFAYDDADPHLKTNYKLPYADVIDGELTAVPRGIFAVAQVLEGARGGVDLPQAVKDEVRDKVEAYYQKMGDEAPW